MDEVSMFLSEAHLSTLHLIPTPLTNAMIITLATGPSLKHVTSSLCAVIPTCMLLVLPFFKKDFLYLIPCYPLQLLLPYLSVLPSAHTPPKRKHCWPSSSAPVILNPLQAGFHPTTPPKGLSTSPLIPLLPNSIIP